MRGIVLQGFCSTFRCNGYPTTTSDHHLVGPLCMSCTRKSRPGRHFVMCRMCTCMYEHCFWGSINECQLIYKNNTITNSVHAHAWKRNPVSHLSNHNKR